ncbi:hypothetical protein Fot_16565 [Forsythia ovata]|uniref:Uncharacterized protein n=1 Tax=Forsythia ovata TaxID=205694 RepID=A0ABD1WBH8_9LAMI
MLKTKAQLKPFAAMLFYRSSKLGFDSVSLNRQKSEGTWSHGNPGAFGKSSNLISLPGFTSSKKCPRRVKSNSGNSNFFSQIMSPPKKEIREDCNRRITMRLKPPYYLSLEFT